MTDSIAIASHFRGLVASSFLASATAAAALAALLGAFLGAKFGPGGLGAAVPVFFVCWLAAMPAALCGGALLLALRARYAWPGSLAASLAFGAAIGPAVPFLLTRLLIGHAILPPPGLWSVPFALAGAAGGYRFRCASGIGGSVEGSTS
jgi:hypothetical protein